MTNLIENIRTGSAFPGQALESAIERGDITRADADRAIRSWGRGARSCSEMAAIETAYCQREDI